MPERGRPREFDTEQVLEAATDVFWRYGYEGASMTDLTRAMGINKPSLYAAFGNKEELFRQVVQRYTDVALAYVREALERPTAFEVAAALLRSNVDAVTRPGRPAGCLTIQGGLSCGPAHQGVPEVLASGRLVGEHALAARFRRALADGDLPPDTDAQALARFLVVQMEGHSVHAAAGTGRERLLASVEIALRAVPGRPGPA